MESPVDKRISDQEISEGYQRRHGRPISLEDREAFRDLARMFDVPQDQSYEAIATAISKEMDLLHALLESQYEYEYELDTDDYDREC